MPRLTGAQTSEKERRGALGWTWGGRLWILGAAGGFFSGGRVGRGERESVAAKNGPRERDKSQKQSPAARRPRARPQNRAKQAKKQKGPPHRAASDPSTASSASSETECIAPSALGERGNAVLEASATASSKRFDRSMRQSQERNAEWRKPGVCLLRGGGY